jgi:hypothetical protein
VFPKKQKTCLSWANSSPVILLTSEAEIRKIVVRNKPGEIFQETLFQKYSTQKRAGRVPQMVDTCLASLRHPQVQGLDYLKGKTEQGCGF